MVSLKDFPNAKEAMLVMIVSFYREMHNRAKGKPCKCGVCRMAQQHLVEELGIDLRIDPRRFGGTAVHSSAALTPDQPMPVATQAQAKAMEEAFQALEKAGEGDDSSHQERP
jgi:hypothetical protein